MRNKEMWIAGVLGALTLTGGCVEAPGESAQEQAVLTGWTAAQLRTAAAITSNGPSTETIVLVGIRGYPNLIADAGTFRANQGLPTLVANQLQKEDQNGGAMVPTYDTAHPNFAKEQALLLQGAMVACPACKYLVIEADSSSASDVGTALSTAFGAGDLVAGTTILPATAKTTIDPIINGKPSSVRLLWGAGEAGFQATAPYPTSHLSVIGVGGTQLATIVGGRGFSESVWGNSGAACDSQTKPTGEPGSAFCSTHNIVQVSAPAQNLQSRIPTSATVSVDADSDGIAFAVGLVAGERFARSASFKLADVYTLSAKFDVTTGNDGSCGDARCQGATAYDGPTGQGTFDMTGL